MRPEPAAAASVGSEHAIRVLLVEDDQDLADALASSLATSSGVELRPVTSLRGALAELERATYDAIVLDLGLPDSQGLQTLARVHGAAPHVPIVVLTGEADEALAVRAATVGAQDYLVKGRVDEQTLVRALRYAIERKRGEEALRRSEERLRLALRAARMGIWDWSPDDDSLTLSDEFLAQLGLDVATAPRTWAQLVALVHVDDRPEVEAAARSVRTSRAPADRLEVRFRVGAGATWVLCTGRAAARRSPRRVSGTIMDITAQKELEAKLLQSQKLESIGRLAGGVAHDFNNLLTVILGATHLAEDALVESSTARGHLVHVREASERASRLTAQLLAFARKQVLQLRSLDLGQIVHELEDMLRRLLGEDVVLAIAVAPGVVSVRADRTQLEQVLVNLAVNAREAMADGGTLRIAVDSVPGASPTEGWVRLTVSDTGIGMPPAVLEHVFEPFFTTKGDGKGTGLGLATCYGIVTQLGGQITVTSAPRAGATFTVLLPPASDPPEQPAPAASRAARGRETILLVEDDPLVRDLAASGLELHGYLVLTAGTSDEALRLARDEAGPIHLLVTDVIMPGMDGQRLAAELRRVRPLEVLFVSGYTADRLQPGARFLQKPFTPTTLARAVREALDAAPTP